MSTLVVLDFSSLSVFFVKVSDSEVEKLVEKYDNNIEAWIAEEGYDDKFGISMGDSHYMMCDGFPQIFECIVSENGDTSMNEVIPPALTKPVNL